MSMMQLEGRDLPDSTAGGRRSHAGGPDLVHVLLVSTYEIGRQPFGVASAAAWLKHEGAHVTCVDVSIEPPPSDTQIAEAALVALHVPMHTATRLAVPIIERVRRINPRAQLCCFGLYATMNQDLLRGLGVETLLSGEFEAGLVALYQRIARGDLARAPVTSVSLARQRFLTPSREGLPSLDRYARVRVAAGDERLAGYTEATRGCKHLCRHCPVVPVYGGRFRVVDIETVLADIDQQIAAGARHITFGDPDFWNGPTHARHVVELLHRRHPDVTYDVTIKVEHLLRRATDLAALRDTGCLFVTSAVEAVDDRVLEILDKGHTRADFVRVVELFRRVGLALVPTFVAFTPWTRLESYLDLLRLLAELDLIENVAPVQLAIRLLVPAGSRLLELPEVRQLVGTFDPVALCHPWQHADARVDALQQSLLRRVRKTESRAAFFAAAWQMAHGYAASETASPVRGAGPPSFVPHLTEPWYC
jgi:radical SAM superfamily enzyme YgiQ (UPF0313 family)